MAYEFKRLSDVEVVAEPTESANVLIEENGVIKKAPKTAIGGAGAGGEEWDVIIEGGTFQDMHITNATWNDAFVPAGSYNKIMEKVNAGEHPKILFKYTYVYASVPYPGSVSISGVMSSDSGGICVCGTCYWSGTPMIFSTWILSNDMLYSTMFKQISMIN